MLSIALGLAAALCWGIHDLLVRRISGGLAEAPAIIVVMLAGALFILPLALATGGWSLMGPRALAIAASAGLAYATGCVGLYRAFRIGPVKLVAPVIGAYPVLSLGGAALAGTTIGPGDWLSVLAITTGIAIVALLSDTSEGDGSRIAAIGWGALGAAGFAATFALGQAAARAGAELPTILATRLATAAFLAILATATGQRLASIRPQLPVLSGMALLDSLALGLVIAAGTLPHPEFAAAASAVFGIVTVLLARLLLAEPVSPKQWAAIALVFAGVAALGL